MQIEWYKDDHELDTTSKKSIIQAMYRFWQFQYEQAKRKYVGDQSRIKSAFVANEDARQEWLRSDNLGFSYPIPFSVEEIDRLKKLAVASEENYFKVKAMYDYFMEYMFDGIHKE